MNPTHDSNRRKVHARQTQDYLSAARDRDAKAPQNSRPPIQYVETYDSLPTFFDPWLFMSEEQRENWLNAAKVGRL